MSETKYYINYPGPFLDGTAYVKRVGQVKVCISYEAESSEMTEWSESNQRLADSGGWREITEGEAKSLVKVSDTSSDVSKEGES